MTVPIDNDEFTQLVDAEIPRVDLVDKAANGLRFILAKRADGSRGLMDPAFVRDLIGRPEPEPVTKATDDGTVTMSGSPAAIARFIHQAAQRASPVEKADMSTADVNDLPDSAFGYIESGGSKDEHGRTTPRSLRHFPLNDADHVRNALSRAPQSPFGDKAMPKIRAAAEKFDVEVSKESDMADVDLDPTTVLAEPDGDAAGIPTNPGSPAWEAIDAATARKWTSILARARAAIDLLADRELMEAASGADIDDATSAMDLQDACCAIDYAISVLAPFAVEEQSAADCGDEMAMVGKALGAWDPEPLTVIESLGPVRKAGRVLSAQNEAAIRGAVESLQKVLASLPAAPIEKAGAPAVVTEEKPDMSAADLPTPTTSAETVADAYGPPIMGVAKGEGSDVSAILGSINEKLAALAPATASEVVAKADGDSKPMMRAVYDSKGNLLGTVDPTKINLVDDGPASKSDGADGADGTDGVGDGAVPQTPDLEPAPAAQVGIPADAVPDGVTKTTNPDNETTTGTTPDDVLKGIADTVAKQLADHSATQQETLAKQTADISAVAKALETVAEVSKTLEGRLKALEEQEAPSKVFANGATPPTAVLRGQADGTTPVDPSRVAELRKGLYADHVRERDEAANTMQALAIERLRDIHQRRA